MNLSQEGNERGAVLALLALFLGIFLFVAALAVDLSALATRGQDLQNTADSAALAAVVEYERELALTADPVAAQAAAVQTVHDLLRQNGIDITDPDINLVVEFPAAGLVSVRITDDDPNSFIGATIPTYDPDVERAATAAFCANACDIEVTIPKPFFVVEATGQGDGYKPISVNDRMYAINHNSIDRNIVCVDRSTQDLCWPTAAQFAYGAEAPEKNPEMPHAAVVNNRIYWAGSNDSGTWLYCWDATFDFSCSPVRLSNDGRAEWTDYPAGTLHSKDEDRGGGAVAINGKVYAFTDNHEIHCYDPAAGGYCAGYSARPYGGMPTALDSFPDNDPAIGNSGSSIDRIVDENTGRIYSTIHIPNAVDCGTELTSGDIANHRVVIQNVEDGRYLSAGSAARMSANALTDNEWWDVTVAGLTFFNFQNAGTSEFLDSSPMGTMDNSPGPDDEWAVVIDNKPTGGAYALANTTYDEALENEVSSTGVGGDFYIAPATPGAPTATIDAMRWNFYPWECGAYPSLQGNAAPADYQSGTWLHCYDTVANTPCAGFNVKDTPGITGVGPMHRDGTRFSGRLWFYHGPRNTPGDVAPKLGVCSSGYGATFEPSAVEVNCVDIASGSYSSTMSNAMNGVESHIQGATRTSPGAWGDPHWNEFENRLFYPTEHHWPDKNNPTPLIICHDFDEVGFSADCGTITGSVNPPPSPTNPAPSTVVTEDYGFFSEGNCVFGLGHTAHFWAFKASNINEDCEAQPVPTVITPCPCGDGSRVKWGTLDFRDLDMTNFDSFDVRITSSNGGSPIFPDPLSNTFVSMTALDPEDRFLALDQISALDGLAEAAVVIYIEAKPGAPTDDLVYNIRFAQQPHLVK